jgi:hypothetical protein
MNFILWTLFGAMLHLIPPTFHHVLVYLGLADIAT